MTYQAPTEARLGFYDWLKNSQSWGDLSGRFVRLMIRPRDEWALVAYESPRVNKMMLPYGVMLCLFGPLIQFWATMAKMLFGPLSFSLASLSSSFFMVWIGGLLNLLVLYAMVQVIHGVALKYGKTVPVIKAYQVALYGLTAFGLAQGVRHLPLMQGAAVIIGLYSLYQLYLGAARLVEVDPADRRTVNLMVPGLALAFYMAILGVAALVVWLARLTMA